MQFREHRSTVSESMETQVTLADHAAMIQHIQERMPELELRLSEIEVELYYAGVDTRTGWIKTYLVRIPDLGIVGFTDSPCP